MSSYGEGGFYTGDLYVRTGAGHSGIGDFKVLNSSASAEFVARTYLNQTDLDTTSGTFNIVGTNPITASMTGATGNIQLYGSATSYLKTTVGNLNLSADTGVISASGTSTTITSTSTTIVLTGETGINLTSNNNNIQLTAAATINAQANTSIVLNSSGLASIDANATSHFTVSGGGNLSIVSGTGRAIINGGSAGSNAITIATTNVAGGIDIDTGTNGINILATNGAFSINGQNVASNISLATNSASQDLTIALTGTTDSSIFINSSGTNTDAIKLTASDTTSGIQTVSGTGGYNTTTTGGVSLNSNTTSNFTLTGTDDLTIQNTAGRSLLLSGKATADAIRILASDTAGGIDIDAGTNGLNTTTTGGISLNSNTTSNFTLTGTDNLTFRNTAGKLFIQSGEANADAIRIIAENGSGGIDIDSGTSGINATSAGTVSINGNSASSNFTVNTSSNSQNLTVALTGTTDSSLILSSTGTNANTAIQMTASAGGITATATGRINITTTDTTNGVIIATQTAGVPVRIGTSTSTTTIAGNLVVQGVSTSVNSTILDIGDNVIELNSSAGELGLDSGLLIRRYQVPNDTGAGDIVSGISVVSSTFQTGSATPGTLVLNSGASGVSNFYNGWWILITTGAGQNQVRRIKTYNGTTKTATLYITADNTAPNITPKIIDGLDLTTAPASGDEYTLFSYVFGSTYYNSVSNRWKFAYSSLTPDDISVAGTSTITFQRHIDLDTGAISIKSDGTASNSLLEVNFINEQDTDHGVNIEGVLIKDGLINGNQADITEIITLLDNSNTGVVIPATSTTGGCYTIIAEEVQGTSSPGNITRATGGAKMIAMCSSTGTNADVIRLTNTKGSANQRINIQWNNGEKVKLFHQTTFTGGSGVNKFYRVKIIASVF